MRLSASNIWSSFKDRRAQQKREVRANSKHPKKVWNMRDHTGWGNSISFTNWERRRVVGWTTPLPRKGDELLVQMESGRTGKFRFAEVEPCYDPSDMWFATVVDVGYVED